MAARFVPAVSLAAALVAVMAPREAPARGRVEVPGAPRFSLVASQTADSLVRLEEDTGEERGRLRDRGELEALAERLRDRLASAGRYEWAIRLTLRPGSGTEPGTALLEVVSTGAHAPRGGEGPRPVAIRFTPPHADGIGRAAEAFASGARGSATPGAIARGMDAVRDLAVASGRYGALVTLDSLGSSGDTVLVHIRVAAGPRTAFEALVLPGAEVMRPGAAARIAGLKQGRALTPASLAEARDRLAASDLFVSVGEPRVVPGSEPGHARVVVPVQESSLSQFAGALGVAPGEGLTGQIDLALGNIAGTGRAAGARWTGLGNGRATYALHYREPALLGRPLDASFALEADVADSLFTSTRWSLALGARPSVRARAGLALARSGAVYSGAGRGSSETWSVRGRAGWEGLAPAANPTRGVAASVELETGTRRERYPGFPEAERSLLRGQASFRSAVPLGGARALYASARAERVSLEGDDFPAEELRYLGGSEGLRGHRDRAYAGNHVLALTLEQRWITDPRGGRAFVFLDAGRHELDVPLSTGVPSSATASLARTELSDGWELGYGAGLQARIHSGLMGFTLGWRPGAALREGTIHLRYASSW